MISMSRAGLLAMIRQGKHGLFLAQKWARPTRIRLRGHVWRGVARVRPYRFDLGRYKDARGFFPFDFFLHRSAPEGWTKDGAIAQRRLWCVWAGDNPMTVNRMHSLDTLKELNPELELTLVTPSNLHRFIVPAHPLHEAYPHLSLPHRSDYLRAYFLHHYGGAYADIKSMGAGMADPVLSVRASDGPWVVGYPEINSDLVDNIMVPWVMMCATTSIGLSGSGPWRRVPARPSPRSGWLKSSGASLITGPTWNDIRRPILSVMRVITRSPGSGSALMFSSRCS